MAEPTLPGERPDERLTRLARRLDRRRTSSAYLEASTSTRALLRFITCGSVDDGKSTLIGRLLYDSKMIFEDQLAALEADSKRVGTQGEEIDFALLVDGLAAEREQGITIDVAYRFFSTEKRKFIVADTPGHEQYTRNMVTGASHRRPRGDPDRRAQGRADPDPAPLLPRAPARHPPHRAGGEQDGPGRLRPGRVRRRSSPTTAPSPTASASTTSPPSRSPGFKGDNITSRARPNTPWYDGPDADRAPGDGRDRRATAAQAKPFRMPVQWVNRPNLDFRGFAGLIADGHGAAGRRGARAAVGQDQHRHAHRHARRRPRRGGRRPVGHPDPRRRDRLLAAAT